jgi:hypothetical protein
VQYHFIRECIENGVIKLEYRPTEDIIADGLTKALATERHWQLMQKMGMKSAEKEEETTTPSRV